MGINVVDLVRCQSSLLQCPSDHEHGRVAAWVRARKVIAVDGGRPADDFGEYSCVARARVLEVLEEKIDRTLTDHRAVAVHVERTYLRFLGECSELVHDVQAGW